MISRLYEYLFIQGVSIQKLKKFNKILSKLIV